MKPFRKGVVSLLVPIVSVAFALDAASAQTVSYFTQGYFTSVFAPCNQTAPIFTDGMVGATCSGSGFSLEFIPTTNANIANGSTISLGQFSLTGTGSVTVPSATVFFHLLVNQTGPIAGTSEFVGDVSGTVSTTGGNFSSLLWAPNENIAIDHEHYRAIFDNIGYAANVGMGIPIDNVRGINALVTVATPEPATFGLTAFGIVAIAGVVRRRRRS